MKKKLLWGGIAVSAVVLLLGALLPAILSFVCKTEKTVSVHGQKFVYENYDQMVKELSALTTNLSDCTVTLTYGDKTLTLNGETAGASYDYATTVQEIEEFLKKRGFWKRFYSCYLPLQTFDLAMSLDTKDTFDEVWTLNYRVGNEAAYPSYNIEGNQLIIAPGTGNHSVDEVALIQEILKEFDQQTGRVIALTEAEKVDVQLGIQQIAELIHQEPQDAYYSEEINQIVPHQVGIRTTYDPLLSSQFLTVGSAPIKLPLTITEPEITTDALEKKLFRDLLGTHTSNYNQGQISRSHNVALAASKLNGRVFKNGDIISYNDIVGQRTIAAGFQAATVYVGNRLEQGIGGGICQVSSTLYAASLRANLEVVERVNHSMPVSYMPAGMDATVSYGSIDLKLKNNTGYPIRIESVASNGKMTINIYGTREDMTYDEIALFNEAIGAIPFTTIEEPVDWLKVGESRVIQNGGNGGIYRVYQQFKKDGQVVQTVLANKSTYQPTPKIVQVGTFPVEAPAVETPAPSDPIGPIEPVTPTGPVEPVDPILPSDELLPESAEEEFVEI